MKNLARSLLRGLGYELKRVSKSPPALIDFLDSRAVDLLIDVGANRGQFGSRIRAQGYSGAIVSFEPIKEAFAELQRVAARDKAWRVFNHGLSDAPGEAMINITENSEFASLHAQTPAAIAFAASARITAAQPIVLKRLDELPDELDGHNVFLKVDTQGHEKQVLDGAGALLKRFCGIQLELPVTPLYQSTWTMAEAFKYMQEKGFAVCQMTANNKQTRDPAVLVDIDVVFRPAASSLDGNG